MEQLGTNRPGSGRLLALDILRAAAVLLVLGRHMRLAPGDAPAWWRVPLELWQCGGWVGVDLFFVLSGFLVSGLLFREYQAHGRVAVGRFLVRRGLKIYPAFYALLAVTVLLDRVWLGRPTSLSHLAAEAAFVQNYFPGLWNHTWSLAVEEHFYLLIPCLVAAVARGRPGPDPFRPLVVGGLGLLALVLVLRWGAVGAGSTACSGLARSHLRVDALGFGVLLSYLHHFHGGLLQAWVRPRRAFLGCLGVLMLTPAFLWPLERTPWLGHIGLTQFYVGSGLLLLATLQVPGAPGWVARKLAVVGAHSYSIYLWHMAVLAYGLPLLRRALPHPSGYALEMGIYLGASLAVGILAGRLIEIPALRLRDRWFPSRAAADRTPIRLSRAPTGPIRLAGVRGDNDWASAAS